MGKSDREDQRVKNVSVVVPWGKRSGNVLRCVESAQAQTLRPLEILVLANGSVTPGLQQEIEAQLSGEFIRFYHLRGCTNANVARNQGAALARGDWVAYLDSDDWWEPDHLAESLASLQAASADFSYAGMIERRIDGSRLERRAGDFREYGGMVAYLLQHQAAQTSSYVLRRTCVLAEPWDSGLRRHQDYDFIIRQAERYRGVFVPRTTVNVDWSTPTKHKFHSDCFDLTARLLHGHADQALIDRHYRLLLKSALKCRDFAWLRYLRQILPALVRARVRSGRERS